MYCSFTLLQWTRKLVLLLCSLVGISASAQQKSVDIGLFEGPTPGVLEVRVRANQQAVSGIVSSLTFALRWPNNSGATLGALNQSAIGNACPALRVNISKDAAGEVVDQGFRYQAFNAFGTNPLSTCNTLPGYNWPVGQWVPILRITVNRGPGCARFVIANDAFSTQSNWLFFAAEGGVDITGAVEPAQVAVPNDQGGGCDLDCAGVPNGNTLPGAPCNDGDPCTVNDTWNAICECVGTFDGSRCPVDIGLYEGPSPDTLEVRFVPNGRNITEVVSAITFTLRWNADAGITLGAPDQVIDGDFCPLITTPFEPDPIGVITLDGFNYLSYNAFGFTPLSDCSIWLQDFPIPILRIPVIGIDEDICTSISIARDEFVADDNRKYFISVQGEQVTGTILTPSLTYGPCVERYYSQASGTISDPIWSSTRVGAPGIPEWSDVVGMVVQDAHVVLVDDLVEVGDQNIETGGRLEVDNGVEIGVYGDTLLLAGTVSTSVGSISLNGYTAMKLVAPTTAAVNDLLVAPLAAVAVQGGLDIHGTLSLLNGEFNATGGTVRLRSNDIRTARLAPVSLDASYVGDLTMQRHIPQGVTNWRLMGSAVQGRTVADWDDDFITAGFPGSNYPLFDQPVASGILWPSVRWYDASVVSTNLNAGLVGVSSMNQPLSAGQGFAVWCGDALGGTAAFVVDVTGEPTIGREAIPFSLTYANSGVPAADGWNLVSNPLPSPISFQSLFLNSDVEPRYYVYDPVSGNTAVWDQGISVPGGALNGTIQSSQGFWLKASGSAPAGSVTELDKTAGNNGGLFGGQADQEPIAPILRLTLRRGSAQWSDQAVLVFEGGSPGLETADAMKLNMAHPSAPYLASRTSDGHAVAINRHGAIQEGAAIPLSVRAAASGNHTLSIAISGMQVLACLYLEDLVTGAIYPLENGTSIALQLTATSTPVQDRFLLRSGAVVPFTTEDVSCYGTSDGQILLQVQTGPVDLLLADAFGTPLATISNATAGSHLFDELGAGNYLLGFAGATGCGSVWETIAVAEPFPLDAHVVTSATSCPGTADGMVALQVLGGTLPYTISWNSGHVGDTLVAAGGSYLATITDAEGCSMEVEATIDTPDGPLAFFTVPEEDILAGQPATFQNGSTAGSSYLWYMGDGSIIAGAEAVHTYLVPGNYTVVLEASLGTCTDTHAENVVVQVTTGVETASSDPRIWSDGDRVWIDALGHAGPWHVELLDVTGRLLSIHGPLNGSAPTAIPTPRYAGVLLVRLTGNGGSTVHRIAPFMAPR
jgi:hypothetical protein